MRALVLVLLLSLPTVAVGETFCEVTICNKLERFTLSPWSMVKDAMGEQCYSTKIIKSDAVIGKILNSSTRWYQGNSMNPTKKSVTRIKSVGKCDEA